MIEYFWYLAVGRLWMYLIRKFPPAVRLLNKNKDTKELLNCDVCLGVWVYTILAKIMEISIGYNENVFAYLVVGTVSSFLMYLIKTGWDQLFREIVIN